jgi:hypothetical protein
MADAAVRGVGLVLPQVRELEQPPATYNPAKNCFATIICLIKNTGRDTK